MSFNDLADSAKDKISKSASKRRVSFLGENKEQHFNLKNIQKLEQQNSSPSDRENESSESRSYGSHSNFSK